VFGELSDLELPTVALETAGLDLLEDQGAYDPHKRYGDRVMRDRLMRDGPSGELPRGLEDPAETGKLAVWDPRQLAHPQTQIPQTPTAIEE
jgi:hypothetical protein